MHYSMVGLCIEEFFFIDISLLIFSFSKLICDVVVLPIVMNITNRFGFFFFFGFIIKLLIKFARFYFLFFLISSLSLELTHYVWVYVQLYMGIFAHLFTKSFNFVVLKIFYTDAFTSLLANFRIYTGNPK